jgi:hypothetical protein
LDGNDKIIGRPIRKLETTLEERFFVMGTGSELVDIHERQHFTWSFKIVMTLLSPT